MLQGGYGAANLNGVFIKDLGILHHHHPVSPLRQHTPGGDLHRLPGPHALGRYLSHHHLTCDREHCGKAFRGTKSVLGPYGIPIHGRPVKPWQVFW